MTKKSRKIIIASVVLVSVAVAVPLTIVHYSKPNFAKMNPRQIRQYFDSNAFRDSNGDARREIFEQMGEVMQARTEAQVSGYFACAEGEDRTAYLDKIIDEMEARRADFMANRDPNRPFFDPNRAFDPNRFADPNRRPRFGQRGQIAAGQRPRINPEGNRARSSRTSADMQVKSSQFRKDLSNRMQQRGIQMPMGRPGGQGGPGGGFGAGRGFGGGPGFGPPP
jgi:hypothetical protein